MNQWVHEIFPFLFFPAAFISTTAGLEEAKHPGGEDILRLIQIRLATPSLETICRVGKTNCRPANDANRREKIANPSR